MRRGLVLVLVLVPVCGAVAAPPPDPSYNSFETDTGDWQPVSHGDVVREPSGFTTGGGYASGVASATGSFHARTSLGDDSPCASGGGPQPLRAGPFTRWDGYSSTFPASGFRTQLAVYLDVAYATAHPDTRFDWVSAINNASSGTFRREFAFNAGTDANGFVVSGSVNATRCGVSPYAGGVSVTQSGWYVMRHTFRDIGGVLSVDVDLIRCGATCPRAYQTGGIPVGSWTLSNPSDAIANVGGNRFGWFENNEFDQLAVDDAERWTFQTPACTGSTASTDYQTAVGLTLTCTGDLDTRSVTSGPSHGSLGSIDQNTGAVTYTPDNGFSGDDTITFRATNAAGAAAPATITVTVGPAPAPPAPPPSDPPSPPGGQEITLPSFSFPAAAPPSTPPPSAAPGPAAPRVRCHAFPRLVGHSWAAVRKLLAAHRCGTAGIDFRFRGRPRRGARRTRVVAQSLAPGATYIDGDDVIVTFGAVRDSRWCPRYHRRCRG
jgi:hypothetical protein